jgi:hypothetical protein
MTYTAFNSAPQAFSNISFKKIKHLASLPVIDPALISIKCLASRYVEEMEDTFNQITNASSNDGYEVTILICCGGIPGNPEWFREERRDLHSAFNILTMETFDKLHKLIREWWCKTHPVFLFGMDFKDSKEKIEPKAPSEIRYALRVIHSHGDKVKPLMDMVDAIHYTPNHEYYTRHLRNSALSIQ